MKFSIRELSTGKLIKPVEPDTEEGILVIGTDGKIYEIRDNGACGDPNCCGSISYYFTDVSDKYSVSVLEEES